MARIAGVDVPDKKKVDVALTYIYGIGPNHAQQILSTADIDGDSLPKLGDLSEEQLNRIREIIDKNYKVEGDLRREVTSNIGRMIEIGSYRGVRHRKSVPVRGQRTKTNARTHKGRNRQTVAGRGRRTGMTK